MTDQQNASRNATATSSSSAALRAAVSTPAPRKITLRDAIGFGIGDFYGGGQLTLIATYLSLFWTRFCGMDIATSQTVIGLSAFVSAVAALGFGVLDDNLYRYPIGRRFGRRRLLLLITAPLLLCGVFLWIPGHRWPSTPPHTSSGSCSRSFSRPPTIRCPAK
ncbi:melibiose carrier protein [Bifidobacterium ramosum]|uniref:Melibiose carrier protein n=1 Tax=Bifidobacterium ramosum TaxID=1798158 RepID=A0A6L4X113_9BIFI|nr:melibiose carrier protein [Bifidobacterium ramosum]